MPVIQLKSKSKRPRRCCGVGVLVVLVGVALLIVQAQYLGRIMAATASNNVQIGDKTTNDLHSSSQASHTNRALGVAAAGSVDEENLGKPPNSSSSSGIVLTNVMRHGDRLGSRAQLVLGVWAVAVHLNAGLCVSEDDLIVHFGFPKCPTTDTATMLPFRYDDLSKGKAKEGLYLVPGGDTSLPQSEEEPWKIISKLENATDEKPERITVWDRNMAKYWEDRIMSAVERVNATDVLWKDRDALHVAVHLRRGDIMSPAYRRNYKHAYMPDDEMIRIISQTRDELRAKSDRPIEVHLFSEKRYGPDKSAYKNIADYIHLSTSSDAQPSLRDWWHFVKADALIIGSTFSAVPALARPPPDDSSGLPMTKVWRDHHGYFGRTPWRGASWWSQFEFKASQADIYKKFMEGHERNEQGYANSQFSQVKGSIMKRKGGSSVVLKGN